MKVVLFIMSSILLTNIFAVKYTNLTLNRVYDVQTKNEEFSYFKFSLKNLQVIPNEISLEINVLKSDNLTSPTIGVYYEPIKMHNYKNLLKTKLGIPVILDAAFIQSALQRNSEIYFAVFSKNSQYQINIVPRGDIKSTTNFVQIPLRGLVQELNNQSDLNTSSTRLAFYSGDGVGALMAAFILVIVSLIGSLIMMNIYVHNTALVEQPLKLGRVEA